MSAKGTFTGVYFILFGLVWVSITTMTPIGGVMSLLGLLIIAYGVYMIYTSLRKAEPPKQETPEIPLEPKQGPVETRSAEDYSGFCPYCGSPVEKDHAFCSVCGKRIRWTGKSTGSLSGSPSRSSWASSSWPWRS